MKDQRIVAAYQAVEPDEAAMARMWSAIEAAADEVVYDPDAPADYQGE